MGAELRLEVGRDGVPACEFVRLNWPRDLVAPRLSTKAALTTLELDFESHSVRALQRLLTEAGSMDRRLAQSARRLRMQLASLTAGKVMPESRGGHGSVGEAPTKLRDPVRR
jgi:hypothetical protein